MKVGNLVMSTDLKGTYPNPGLVIAVDKDYYGARQAFKVYADVPRGKALRPNMVDGFGPTVDGIRDRVLVHWPEVGWSYHDSKDLEAI
tara:strand:+ start:316 stop:579 length:264 start_codon:yes stop_codon:yes gene_type:complete